MQSTNLTCVGSCARQLEKIVCLQNDFHNMPMVLRLHNVHTSTCISTRGMTCHVTAKSAQPSNC